MATASELARRRYEEARDAKPGTHPPVSPGVSEARMRYWEWREAANPADYPHAAPHETAREQAEAYCAACSDHFPCRECPLKALSA